MADHKLCVTCGITYFRKSYTDSKGYTRIQSSTQWSAKKYCSKQCLRFPNRDSSGNNNPSWKGDAVKYAGLHSWIRKHFGRPAKCEFCNQKNTSNGMSRIQWAARNGIYNRNRENWITLCSKCHVNYDRGLTLA